MVNIDVYGLAPNVSVLRFVLATIFKNELAVRNNENLDGIGKSECTKLVTAAMRSVKFLEDLRNGKKEDEECYDYLEELSHLREVMQFRDYFLKLLKLLPSYSEVILVNKNGYYNEMQRVIEEDLAQAGIKIHIIK